MSGRNRFLLDTNAIVSLLAGNRKLSALLVMLIMSGYQLFRIWNSSPLMGFPTLIAPALPVSAHGLKLLC